MWVSRLALRDFRSYDALDLDLEPGVTAFVAPNGWGKTNLVESIGYLSRLRSHRVSQDLPLVRAGCEEAVVSARAHRGRRHVTAEVTIRAKGANRARINRTGVRVREILGLVPCVVFAPEDLGLVKGDPGERRDWLDSLLVARSPRYAGVLADADRALRQRNALLKNLRQRPDPGLEGTLDIWDRAFAEAAAALVTGRRRLLGDLEKHIAGHFSQLAADARESRRSAAAEYSSRIDYGSVDFSGEDARERTTEVVLEALASRRRKEIDRGLTLVGPQRDDVLLGIGGAPAKGYASHGESWSLALALQLAGWDLLREDSGDPDDQPILVLDDVFAELDSGRRARLAQTVAQAEQVLITAAVGSEVPEELTGAVVDLTGIARPL
ncbi:DNA replication/repair protein RecF [Brevibacterium album]|uniref:DNA replication/repair protein RecF n=1 Tax=Brevibacterium album TaxID=417948 RepID=UPI0004010656|nr:DNA replication/repair protein RecF [Brevibacterium album]